MQSTQPNIQGRRLSPEDVRTVAPALEEYTRERLDGDVWKRPDLTSRDRSPHHRRRADCPRPGRRH